MTKCSVTSISVEYDQRSNMQSIYKHEILEVKNIKSLQWSECDAWCCAQIRSVQFNENDLRLYPFSRL